MRANDINRGQALKFDGELYAVVETSTTKPGKGGSFVRAKLKNLKTGLVSERRLRSDENVEDAFLEKRPMQYLYQDHTGYVFMDLDTYEQFTINEDLIGDDKYYLVPELEVTVLMHEGQAISVDLPTSVTMTVTDTDAAIKGQTAAKSNKPAVTDTGLRVMVPTFINNGDVIKVDTKEGNYMGREETA